MAGRAEGKNALLGPAFLFIAPRAAKILNDEPEAPDLADHKDMRNAIRDGKKAAIEEGTASGGSAPKP